MFSFQEKNHKTKLSENPQIETAVETAEGPGIGNIFILLLIHSLTKMEPGSEILSASI